VKFAYLISGVVALAAVVFVYKNSRFGVASPEYEVIHRDGDFEIREYPPMVVVETPMAGPDVAEGTSFMRLFRYISGSNETEQTISMTTPVVTSQENGQRRMSFIVPEGVAADGAPRPTSEDVEVHTLAGGPFAAYRFSGRWSPSKFDDAARKLEQWLQERELEALGSPMIANYDPPFTPPFLRRNEVWIRLMDGNVRAGTR
jgi:DNA gyrase inhibitor GyrI